MAPQVIQQLLKNLSNKLKVTPTAKKPHKYLGAAFGKRGLGHLCVVSRHPTLVPGLSSVNSGSEHRFPKIRGLRHTPILYPGSSIEKKNATKIQGLSFLGLTLSILRLSWAVLGCLGPHQVCIEPRRANYVSEQPATPRRVPDCSTPISIPKHVHRITKD
jgi:hypothetical protein